MWIKRTKGRVKLFTTKTYFYAQVHKIQFNVASTELDIREVISFVNLCHQLFKIERKKTEYEYSTAIPYLLVRELRFKLSDPMEM